MQELHSQERATRWPNGRFIEGTRDPAQGRHSVRRRILELLGEQDGAKAAAVARALVEKAEAGNLPAIALLLEHTEQPISKQASDGSDVNVVITYVHQQLNVSAPDPALSPPPHTPTDRPR